MHRLAVQGCFLTSRPWCVLSVREWVGWLHGSAMLAISGAAECRRVARDAEVCRDVGMHIKGMLGVLGQRFAG